MLTLENFYKDAIKIVCGAGAGNIYVTTKPVPTTGYLVINPSSASKREIVYYSSTGTDAQGDYIVIASASDRGLGGTTAQTHEIDESVRMNYTAEHHADIKAAIDAVATDLAVAILAGAGFASTTIAGIARLTASPDYTLGVATITIATPGVVTKAGHGLTLNDRVKFSTTGSLPTGIVAGTEYFVIATGLTTDEFQISATLGGSAINTSGSQSGVHTLVRTTPRVLSETDSRVPSTELISALGGSQGVPGSANKFNTQDNTSVSTIDQSQTTQNGSVEVGEADATGRKNQFAQSFIPTKTKIRGFKLYKNNDTGTFTGNIVVTLQADVSGSPSGTPLATYTITNFEWKLIPVGEFTVLFNSEYTSLVPGDLYWIDITTSTSDTSNHPNLGTNTGGGYGNGSAKYKNTTDGWVAIATIDLYFKTLEGNKDQIVKTDSSGYIPKDFIKRSQMPLALFQQRLATDLGSALIRAFYTPTDGSYFLVAFSGNVLQKFVRDANTGIYRKMYSVSCSSTSKRHGLVVVGNYVYEIYDTGTNLACNRYDLADLANQTAMTIPTVTASGSPDVVSAWTDGVYIYVVTTTSGTTSRKWSISGTVLTEVSTATVPGNFTGDDHSSFLFVKDKWYLFTLDSTWTSTRYRTFALADGSDLTGTTAFKLSSAYSDTFSGAIMIPTDTEGVFYFGTAIPIYDETGAVQVNLIISPITFL